MKISAYLHTHAPALLGQAVLILLTDALLLTSRTLPDGLPDFLYLNILYLVCFLGFNLYGYAREHKRYSPLRKALDQATAREGLYPEDDSFLSRLLWDAHQVEQAEWRTHLAESRQDIDDLQNYITQWTHEIKIPLSVEELILDNMPEDGQETVRKLRPELERTKYLVNQVLYVGRATHYQEDLSVREFSLRKVVQAALRTNSWFLRGKDIEVELENLDHTVLSDDKWVTYILEQLLNNAAKYVPSGGCITMRVEPHDKGITLFVRDNGVGIPPDDLPRIFDKGFTGANGRRSGKSTGMGLYYAKRIADRLGIGLAVRSEVDVFTEFQLSFYTLGDWFTPAQ